MISTGKVTVVMKALAIGKKDWSDPPNHRGD